MSINLYERKQNKQNQMHHTSCKYNPLKISRFTNYDLMSQTKRGTWQKLNFNPYLDVGLEYQLRYLLRMKCIRDICQF